jgi:hypothetical protein
MPEDARNRKTILHDWNRSKATMLPMRVHCPSLLHALLAVSLLCIFGPASPAQEMDHHSQPTVPSAQLNVKGQDGKSITFSPEEFAALPHKSVSVYNAHSKTNEKYSVCRSPSY